MAKKTPKKEGTKKKHAKKEAAKKKDPKKEGAKKKKSKKREKSTKKSKLISVVDIEMGLGGEDSGHNIADEESELETQKREMLLGEETEVIQPLGCLQDYSQATGKETKKVIKSAMKEGKERAVPYSHSEDLADPWKKKRRKESEGFKFIKELLGMETGLSPSDQKKTWPTKHGTPTLDMRDFMDEIPKYLKDVGILKLFQRIIMNLYVMHPRPKNPCLEIFHLLDKWFGASDKSTVVETLEKEFHMKLLKELRMIQEIGKLKTLCHFLLPEEYGPEGEVLEGARRPPSDEDILVEYVEDPMHDDSKSMTSQATKKKCRRRKDKDKEKAKAKRSPSKSSFVSSLKYSVKKKKKTKLN